MKSRLELGRMLDAWGKNQALKAERLANKKARAVARASRRLNRLK